MAPEPQNWPITHVKSFDEEVHDLAIEYGQDEQLARKIINCESNASSTVKHLNTNGTTDHGYWQINDVHKQTASDLNIDFINNSTDNLRFGFILMKEQGSTPWKSSVHCWGLPKGG